MRCRVNRRRRRVVRALAIAGALSALVPVTSQAAVPITIAAGHKPGVALDLAGTAHLAWNGPEATISSLQVCRLPRGAATCERRGTLPAPGTSLSRPFVIVSGNTVAVVSHRYGLSGPNFDEVWEFLSRDGGQTWDAGRPIGSVPFDEGVVGPGVTLSVATNAVTQGLFFQNMPLGGSAGGRASALLSTTHPYNGTVGLIDAATPLVVYANGSSLAQFRRYRGFGSLNDAANWTPPVDIGYADYPRLAGGPSGLFLLSGTPAGGLVVRKYNGAGFTPGVTVSSSGDDAQDHLSQDAGGRLHAVFPRLSAEGMHLVYATSDDGVNWQSDIVFTQAGAVSIAQLRAATAPDHVGVAAFESTIGGVPQVRVVAIGLPAPALGKTVNVRPVSGRVRVSLPPGVALGARAAQVKGRRFVALTEARQVPVRSLLDTRKGTVRLTSARNSQGATQSGNFSGGVFQVLQSRKRSAKGLTELRLKGSSFRACRRSGRPRGASAAAARRIRRLRGNARGRFRTRGRHSAATVRGTIWTVTDRCDGTLTQVRRGRVRVRDFRRKRTITVRAGKRYLARAPR